MSIEKNAGGELSGHMLSQKGRLPEQSSSLEIAPSAKSLDEIIADAEQHLRELKYKPNLTAKELEEAEDYLREMQQKKKSLSN
jgi:hypothetical protein